VDKIALFPGQIAWHPALNETFAEIHVAQENQTNPAHPIQIKTN